MLLSFIGILITGLQGFFQFNIYNANHIAFAFIPTILYMFTQTLIMFYFIGAGKKVKETIIKHDLNKQIYQDVIEIKRKMFPPLTLNMLFVGTAFILGGGVHTGLISKNFHSWLFIFSMLHLLYLMKLQDKGFKRTAEILSHIGELIKGK